LGIRPTISGDWLQFGRAVYQGAQQLILQNRVTGAIDEGERPFWWQGDDLASQAGYAAEVLESAFDALAALPGADEEQLRSGLEDLRGLSDQPGAGLGWIVHKSTAVR
jgi:hypothetical protein